MSRDAWVRVAVVACFVLATAAPAFARPSATAGKALPRGAFGRSPMTAQTALQVSDGHPLSKTMVLECFLRVFDVFDQQEELDADGIYTTDAAMPIVGGDRADRRARLRTEPHRHAVQELQPSRSRQMRLTF